MAGSRTPRNDPTIRAFDNELKRCTLYTPSPPVACGRPYVRVRELSKWFRSYALREDGSTDYQARFLLDYAYRQWPGYPRIGMSTTKLFDKNNECIIIFSILLKMDRGCLVHFFRSQETYDRDLPINVERLADIFLTVVQFASEHGHHIDPISLAHEFDDLQYQFCPAKFYLGEERHFNHKQVIPIAEKSKLGDGGTAVLWQVAILDEFVTEELANTVQKSRYSDSDDNLGNRYHFALKTFKQGHKHEYNNEVEAFCSLTHSGMIQYLGCYTQNLANQVDARRGGIVSGEASTQDTCNILLEFGECDLWTVFNEESSVPPVLQSDIDSFWTSLFNVAYTLSQIHYLPDTVDKKGEFWGWHADIKPSNILEIDRQFKLADPGFAIFKKKVDNARPTTELSGGTKTYSAPEQSRHAGVREFYQTVDVWALGCVFSIAATWIALGHQGVQTYTQLREKASDRAKARMSQTENSLSLQLTSGDYFHNGSTVLPEVTAWHEYIRNILRGTDRVTKQVLDVVDKCMLIQDPLERWQSSEVYEKLYKIGMGLEDPNTTVPSTIIAFLESSAEEASPLGSNSALDKAVVTSGQANKMHGRKDKKSRYLSSSLQKAWVKPSFTHREYGQSPITPETPSRTHSRIMSGVLSQSPTQSALISPVIDSSDNEHAKQALQYTQPKSPPLAKPLGKVEDIFQANEKIEESQSTMNKVWSMGKKPIDEYLAKHYRNRDIKFLVDNSWSMHKHWAHVKFVLKTLAAKAKGLDPDGTDLYFTLGPVKAEKTKGVKPLIDAMNNRKAVPATENDWAYTDMATQLNNLFEEHLTRVAQSRRNTGKLTIIVLTNAMWDGVSVAKRIVEFAKKLEKLMQREITDRPVSIQFIQFGRDQEATDRLKQLDDELETKGIPDLVDAEHADGNVYKMLLGSFVPVFDNHDTETMNNEDAATSRPTSSETETYFESSRRDTRRDTVNTYSLPPTLSPPFSNPGPLTYRLGPSPTRQTTFNESHGLDAVPQRQESQRQARSLDPRSREERRNTNATHRPNRQASGSRDPFF